MDKNRPETGINVKVLDLKPLLDKGLEKVIAEMYGSEKDAPTELCLQATYGIAHKPDGTPVLLCTEGVGCVLDEGAVEKIAVYTRCGNKISMFPSFVWEVTADWVDDLLTYHSEDMPLEKFVRSFGARLESNFHALHRELSSKEAA